jgi:BirA family biotin operon repressor/biotin-[acetyl-CoA-carboxylase] ligase
MQLDPTAVAAGFRLMRLDVIGSTNAEALARARGGDRGRVWITARSQTAGRGRRGRAWVSEPGNLYATLLLIDPATPERAAELSFVAALAVSDAILAVARQLEPRLSLKWPNDILYDGAKLAGILIEGEGGPWHAVAIGIGVNCAAHPADTACPSTDLRAAGAIVSPERLFTALTAAMAGRLRQWNGGGNFASIRADWLSRAAALGREIDVQTPEGMRRGVFETLDERGRLVVRLADGSWQTVTAGDVFLADRAAAAGA